MSNRQGILIVVVTKYKYVDNFMIPIILKKIPSSTKIVVYIKLEITVKLTEIGEE